MEIIINNTSYEFFSNETVLDVCKRNGIFVPTLCFLKNICETSNCRVCVVENKNGRLTPACSTKCVDGDIYLTDSEKVLSSRKHTIEMFLSNHHFDCALCRKADYCKLQELATYYGFVPFINPYENKEPMQIDSSSPCIVRDNNKCILCGRCINVCANTQEVHALTKINRGFRTFVGCANGQDLKHSTCVGCGQCTLVCPTGALIEHEEIDDVEKLLANKGDGLVIAQVAPSVRVALAESFGGDIGTFDEGHMVACIKKLGFDKVFDINFGADFTTYEEASELLERIKENKALPQFSSCCPAWFKYVKNFYPEFESNLSGCKSPTEMLGALIKNYYHKTLGIDTEKIKVIGIMPCTAKKGEKLRAKDVDNVLCTRELAKMIISHRINYSRITPCDFDIPENDYKGGGLLYGASGGVTESVLRYVASMLGDDDTVKFEVLRNSNGINEFEIKCKDTTLNLCIVSGLANAKSVMEEIKAGKKHFHFMEVMACPGGCVNGGGQSWVNYDKTDVSEVKAKRRASMYARDRELWADKSISNRDIEKLYKDFLINSREEAEKLFHY